MKMTFEDLETLVIDYGNACENFGEYHTTEHIKEVEETQKELLDAIKKLLTNC